LRSTAARRFIGHTLESPAVMLRRHRADGSVAKAARRLIRANLIV
jgi:hypothetical protein